MHTILRKAASVAVSLFFSAVAFGQVATGMYAHGTYDSRGFDTINVGNLNVHFSVPVLSKAGRGMDFTYALHYDNSVWYPTQVNGALVWTPVNLFGWGVDTQLAAGSVSYSTTTTIIEAPSNGPGTRDGLGDEPVSSEGCTGTTFGNFIYYDQYGASHTFMGTTYQETGDCTQIVGMVADFTETARDGSGYVLTVSNFTDAKITSPNGSTITPTTIVNDAGSVMDSNGNRISMGANGTFIDTTGHVALAVAGAAPNAHTFTYEDVSGNSRTVSMTYRTYMVQTAFGCSGVGEYGPLSTSLVDSIIYPDGSSYHFSYEATPGGSGNVTGRLAGVELPQGGWINYTYSGGNNGIECTDGSIAGLTRMIASDSGSAASTVAYSRSTGTSTSHTDVVDGLSNHLAYDFVEPSTQSSTITAAYYETHRSVYQGAASGTPVVAKDTCYNGVVSSCTGAALTLPITSIATIETLDGIQSHGTTETFNEYGMETEVSFKDFGSSFEPLLSEDWAYGTNIASLPTLHVLYAGYPGYTASPSTQIGLTIYKYDEGTTIKSSGVPQHASGKNQGNLTSLTQYADPGTTYSYSYTYEDTGSVLSWTTPNGTTTTSYDSTYTYPTGTVLPTPSSGILLESRSAYDTSNTGVLLTSTDLNGNMSTVASYDSMLRATEIDSPDTGKTIFSYTPTQMSQKVYQTSSVYSDTEVLYDGYGRQSRSAVANGQGGNAWYQKDICYDGNGRTQFISNTYQGTGLSSGKICSGNGDSYTYDVLGRVTNITRANGETINYTYYGRATKVVDENNVARISQVDALGRTTIVCEVSSSTMPSSGTPTNCGTDIAGTGYVTTYTYDLPNHKTTVTQGVQTRVFQTDWLGRIIFVQEPESGITTYSYSYNATGLKVTRKRPRANQQDPSVQTTTAAQYDASGRVISIVYDDGTPTKTFAYDASVGWSNLAQTNLKGRLSLASASGAATAFSYDAMGRTSVLDECFPSGCGTGAYDKQLHYTYDLAGNVIGSTDGAGVTTSYTVSPANEILSLSSSRNDTTNPSNILSSAQFSPNGPVSYSLGNGLAGAYSYDTLGRVSGGTVSKNAVPLYSFSSVWHGARLTSSTDLALGQGATYGYDDFNRLTSRTVNTGSTQNLSWVYDRYGNRLQQNVTAGSAPQPQYSVNTANNQIIGYSYDAAGNMLNDGQHSYTYDADGNITAVDGGSTATYVYNALNQRVRVVALGAVTEFVFDRNGKRASVWNGSTHSQLRGQYYWGSKPVAYYANNSTHFQHQDWLGTERKRTRYDGIEETTLTSLPFGDSQASSSTDDDAYHYASLDHDSETNTDHAQFRQYSSTQGRWLSPDPYLGSYDSINPQSFNRYEYVMNIPLSYMDQLGLAAIPCPGGGSYTGSDGILHIKSCDDCGSRDCLGSSGSSGGSSGGAGSSVSDTYAGDLGAVGGDSSGAASSAASLELIPSLPWARQMNKLMCVASYQSCLLAVGFADLECKILKLLPKSPIAPISPILCGDLTKQLAKAACARQLEECMNNSGGADDDKILPTL